MILPVPIQRLFLLPTPGLLSTRRCAQAAVNAVKLCDTVNVTAFIVFYYEPEYSNVFRSLGTVMEHWHLFANRSATRMASEHGMSLAGND